MANKSRITASMLSLVFLSQVVFGSVAVQADPSTAIPTRKQMAAKQAETEATVAALNAEIQKLKDDKAEARAEAKADRAEQTAVMKKMEEILNEQLRISKMPKPVTQNVSFVNSLASLPANLFTLYMLGKAGVRKLSPPQAASMDAAEAAVKSTASKAATAVVKVLGKAATGIMEGIEVGESFFLAPIPTKLLDALDPNGARTGASIYEPQTKPNLLESQPGGPEIETRKPVSSDAAA